MEGKEFTKDTAIFTVLNEEQRTLWIPVIVVGTLKRWKRKPSLFVLGWKASKINRYRLPNAADTCAHAAEDR